MKSMRIEVDLHCIPCEESMECPTGSTLAKLEANVAADPELPRLRPMYFSTPAAPLSIYRCVSGCPGGAPGSCQQGRQGLTCGECEAEFYMADGVCQPCETATWGLLMFGAIAYVVGVTLRLKDIDVTCSTWLHEDHDLLCDRLRIQGQGRPDLLLGGCTGSDLHDGSEAWHSQDKPRGACK